MTEVRQLGADSFEQIKHVFREIFSKEPWCDDWSDDDQLDAYIRDLAGNANSLTFGLFEDGELAGLSIGSIKHWYKGTEYYIDEFGLLAEYRGRGLGSVFMQEIERIIRERGLKAMFLQTGADVPAFRFYEKCGFHALEGHVSLAKSF
ncbi:MAG: GNAT family N-acetyltransferase [Oscillospiraceae bacterium]|nr:GNAT family N-acetyltransferase [Oscillospiraceae bacterium]